MYKTCGNCKENKLFSEFFRDNSKKDGLRTDCKVCRREYQKTWRELNKQTIIKYMQDWYIENKESVLNYRELNKEKISDYYKKNRDKYNSHAAKRRASKLNATPRWLTNEDIDVIQSLYNLAKELELKFNVSYHVDHIVPLINDRVCGLHVPWNLQVIPASENLSKSNKLQEQIL
jgi:hypothetical protein